MENYGFAAELIKRSAGGYAGVAASVLFDHEPDLRSQAGGLDVWKSHLTQRLLELSAALGVGEPRLFTERVVWSRKTFAARNQDDRLVGSSLQALREVLRDDLPGAANEPALAFLDAALDEVGRPAPQPDASELDPHDPCGRLALAYLQDVLEGNGATAVRRLVQAVADGLAVESAYVDVLLAAQREIGRLWHAAEVRVAEEHLVTMTTQQAMAVLAFEAERAPANNATIVVACLTGNAHDTGARALADLLYLAGWRSVLLGADVPVTDLPATLDAFAADVVALNGTLTTQSEHAAGAVRLIHEQCQRPVRVLVGGALFDEAPDLARRIGADAYSGDIREAVHRAAELRDQQAG